MHFLSRRASHLALITALTGVGLGACTQAKAATYTVNTTAASGMGSLSWAVAQAQANPGADTINFQVGSNQILIPGGGISINDPGELTIQGPGANALALAGNGGRIFDIQNSNVTIRDLQFINADVMGSSGGAIATLGTTLLIERCSFVNNRVTMAGDGGHLFVDATSSAQVKASYFTAGAAENGGAIAVRGSLTLINSTLYSNSATFFGGGVHLMNPTAAVIIQNSTIVGNTLGMSAGQGAGIYFQKAMADLRVQNSMLLNNQNTSLNSVDDLNGTAPFISNGANIFENVPLSGTTGTDVTGANTMAIFSAAMPGDHGGPVPSLQPLDSSPAVDAGANGDNSESVDARGFPRVVDRVGNGPRIDIGAVELSPARLHVLKSGKVNADGASWGTAMPELRDALAYAGPGTEVWVGAGVYHPVAQDPMINFSDPRRDISFKLCAGCSIVGGFAGGEMSATEADPLANPVILSGDIDGNDMNTPVVGDAKQEPNLGNNSRNVVTASDGGGSMVLAGVTVTAGAGDGTTFPQGGGIAANGVNLSIFDTEVVGNRGGGALFQNGAVIFTNVTFAGNHNIGKEGGGARFDQCTIGATRLFFFNNSATSGGGLIAVGGTLDGDQLGLFGNSGAEFGGGAYLDGVATELRSSVFSGNQSKTGGAVHALGGGTFKANFLTVAGNGATMSAPGILIESSESGEYTTGGDIANSILWGNLPMNQSPLLVTDFNGMASSPVPITHCDIQLGLGANMTDGGGNIGTDPMAHEPMFVNPVGPDGMPGTGDDNLSLQAQSPCVNAGTASWAGGMTPGFDYAGGPREVPMGMPDIGAYEQSGVAPNNPPAFETMPNVNATVGNSYEYTAVVSDSDSPAQNMVITVVQSPSWLVSKISGNGSTSPSVTFTGTPMLADVGMEDMTIEVTDDQGAKATQMVTITVTNPMSMGGAGGAGMGGDAGAAGEGGASGAAGEGGSAGGSLNLPDPWGTPPDSAGGSAGSAGAAASGGGGIEPNLPSGVGGNNASAPRGEAVENTLDTNCSVAQHRPTSPNASGAIGLLLALTAFARRKQAGKKRGKDPALNLGVFPDPCTPFQWQLSSLLACG